MSQGACPRHHSTHGDFHLIVEEESINVGSTPLHSCIGSWGGYLRSARPTPIHSRPASGAYVDAPYIVSHCCPCSIARDPIHGYWDTGPHSLRELQPK